MITIIGSGVVGLTCADMLIDAGCQVQVITASTGVDESACSWWAGGMLAPYCEMESAEPLIGELSGISMRYWQSFCKYNADCEYTDNGTVVISPNRDQNMLKHFAQKTQQWKKLGAKQLHDLEPILHQHQDALFYPTEAHIEPRRVLRVLWKKVCEHAKVVTSTTLSDAEIDELATSAEKQDSWLLDCRGYSASAKLSDIRGVRGEMIHLYNTELSLSRPVRLLHPRFPIYLVPRANQQFMLGATMIESASRERASVRSVMELLSAVYAVNPAFSQSEIVEIGVDVRPTFPDNLPKIIKQGRRLLINGMYRHGYLLAPACAKIACDLILQHNSPPALSALIYDEHSV
ncbi:FAD-dependent oxidoreductase [Psychrobacter sp. DM4]|uniref:FAD-dependent oxidoreductase n=1 Tax=Psychrobacter sp. DM4 TaxID=3440637 RepID=UPI003F50A222